jgi:ubiquitin-protein ligase
MATARRRIQQELTKFNTEPSPYYSAQPRQDNILIWDVNIHGLPALHQMGKNYDLEITIPNDYPFYPPSIKVLSPINRSYIDSRTGELCSDILLRGHASAWSPSFTMEAVLIAVCSILTDNEPERRSPRLIGS